MKTETTNLIGVIIIVIVFIGTCCYISTKEHIKYKDSKIKYEYQIDSLNYKTDSIINYYDKLLEVRMKSIDSLYEIKNKIVIRYETKYKDYLNPTTVDDDSICRYISTKIHNRKR